MTVAKNDKPPLLELKVPMNAANNSLDQPDYEKNYRRYCLERLPSRL